MRSIKGLTVETEKKYYLRQNVQVEPLVDRWYAWPHLIPPATAARNVTQRHLKIMDSYTAAPQVHAQAACDPKMIGGPFIDYQGQRVDEIRALRTETQECRGELLALSAAIAELEEMLRQNAKGYSLHALYDKVPDILRGYVELAYDLNNYPSFRLIEPLLYASEFYDPSLQSIMLQTISQDERPFILSTPRLDSPELLHLHIPFGDQAIDALFRLKSKPESYAAIKDLLAISDEQDSLMRSFLTEEEPPRYERYSGEGIRWRYFGHACILIEADGLSVLVDPVLSYTYEGSVSRYTYLDLPDVIDYVLITHNHQDHVLFETMLQLRHKIKNILVPRNGNGRLQDLSLKLLLEQCGFERVTEVSEFQSVQEGDVRITGLPFFGEHADLDIGTKLAWHVKMGSRALLFVADSCNIEPLLYERTHALVGDVDVLFLGMECDGAPLSWLYGTLLTKRIERAMDESRRLSGSNCEQGMRMVDCLRCKEVYVYAMGQEPWLNYIMSIKYNEESQPIVQSNMLVKRCREQGIVAERLFGEKEMFLELVPEEQAELAI